MCSARKVCEVLDRFSLFQGFLVEFWCARKSHWNEQKDVNKRRCSSDIFSFLAGAKQMICRTPPLAASVNIKPSSRSRFLFSNLEITWKIPREKRLNTVPYLPYRDRLLPYIGMRRPYTGIYGIVFRRFSCSEKLYNDNNFLICS